MENTHSALFGSLIADSFAMGLHWIYNTELIDKGYSNLSSLMDPVFDKYHGNRRRGEHTHYGDQTLILLRHLAENRGFDEKGFRAAWLETMKSYDGYMDRASTDTLARPDHGSASDDLAGAARIAPLALFYSTEPEAFRLSAAAQTRVTHNNRATIAAAEAIAEITSKVLSGGSATEAIEEAAQTRAADDETRKLLEDGLSTKGESTRGVIKAFGQSCSLRQALPGAVHLIVTYQDDYRQAMVENARAGGDGAARGMVVGLVIGAAGGEILEDWLAEYRHREAVREILGGL